MMRRKLPLLFGAAVLALATGACEGPKGPTGPTGPEGPPGPDGLDGALCSDCHTENQDLVSIQQLFSASPHGPANYELRGPDYAGGSCIACHTSQGFTAAVKGESADFTGGVASMSCRTCHQIHTDERGGGALALQTTDPLTLRIGGETVDLGKGNLCANCHQGRTPDLMPAVGAGGQDTIPSSHFGTHHGPQANVMAAGPGLPVFPGSETVPTEPFSFHITLDGTEKVACVGCHMQSTAGTNNQAGGHTWSMMYGGEVLNDGTCDACHTDVTTAYADITAEVQPLLDDIGACLLAEGVVDSAGSPVSGAVVDNDLIAAFLVWQTLTEDGSHGAHHPTYVPAILKNTSAYLDANYASCAP